MTELTIDQALQQAIESHKAGQVKEADRLYTAILKAQPKHPDANHNMGVLAVGFGKVEQALPFFKTALEANPAKTQFWLSYIDALIKLGKLAKAKAVLDQAKSKGAKGDDFDKLEHQLNETGEEHAVASKLTAEVPPQQPNILDSLKLDQALKLATKKAKEGSSEEAKRIYQDILTKFSKNKRARDGLKGLTGKTFGKASKVQDPPQQQLQLLINLYSQGQLQQALKQAGILVQQFPQSAILFNIQGAVLKGLGQLDASVESYNKAIAIKPNYADAYNNMGNALKEQGKLQEAIEAFNNALAIKPDHAEAYNNMGNALKEQGKLDEAIEASNKALAIKPNYADAYNNMGNALKEQGKLQEAIAAYNKALTIKPDYAEAYSNMGLTLQGVAFKNPNPDLQKVITSLLDKKSFVRPRDIAPAAISLLKFEPRLKRHLQTSSVAEPEPKLPEVITDLSKLPLLLKLMSVCPLPDMELEDLFRRLRASLLLSISDLTGSAQELEFQSALALQCFTNEYIYNQNEHEDEALAVLEVAVKEVLNKGEQPSPQAILCLASFRPLNQYDWSSSLRNNDEIDDVFVRQIAEPNQELQIKTVLPMLEEITDKVSSKVRDQYELSPYPRWVSLGLRLRAAPISKVVEEIKLKLFDDQIKKVEAPNILIAGCGTGQHSIVTAARFKGSNVLAIDLSLSSMSYAKRKTEELGIQNIDYMQADILDLGKLGRRFDIVESAGVLHHMDDPVAGWRVLTDCLKPGGLMKIGLYSELARKHIVEMRKEISKAGIGSNDAAMKSFRTTVVTSGQSHHKKILNSSDFYSLSELKDLIFHVQEHRFTIPQIRDSLSELGLKFCGFESAKIVSHFKLTNTGASDPYDLNKWQTYEVVNPRAFAGMYQFWCQKIA
ncbi:Beta-barrel assembly-enhancing protease [Rhodobacteraceae bacterium IMCC1909]|nr:Beta-barrel assembly-enhancing protease [Rhodobacteraceae bacterium IMCC1923]MDP4072605.1 Beta-barrel assembly-enhancing protease [Rhodobacteraceae bacterium IMCC1909]